MRAFILPCGLLADLLSADNMLRQFSRFQKDVSQIVFSSPPFNVLIRRLELQSQPCPCLGTGGNRR